MDSMVKDKLEVFKNYIGLHDWETSLTENLNKKIHINIYKNITTEELLDVNLMDILMKQCETSDFVKFYYDQIERLEEEVRELEKYKNFYDLSYKLKNGQSK